MGSNDNAMLTISKPFSIREYVFAARHRDIRLNWPFPEEYLGLCMKHGVTRVLPPFECHNSSLTRLNKDVGSNFSKEDKGHFGSNNKSCVEIGGDKEVVKVGSEHGEDSGLNYDVALHPISSKVHISTTKPSFNFLADFTSSSDQYLSIVPCTKKWMCKRKKRKGKLKKRSMVDIYANARSCTLKDLDKMNWDIGLSVIPYIGDQSVIRSKNMSKVNGSVDVDFDCRHNSVEGFWKTEHPGDDNAEIGKVMGKKRRIMKIYLNRCNFKSQNGKALSLRTDETKGKCVATTEFKFGTAFKGIERGNPEWTQPKDSIILRKESGHSEIMDLTTTHTKCLKGLNNNSHRNHPPTISNKNSTLKHRR